MRIAHQLKERIEQKLVGARAEITSPDGEHFQAVIICPAFGGKSLLEQHRMVHKALGELRAQIHALSIDTREA